MTGMTASSDMQGNRYIISAAVLAAAITVMARAPESIESMGSESIGCSFLAVEAPS